VEKVDYIIVGQGLAGSAVAAQFLKRGRRILVFDIQEKNYSTRVAAGLFNPITGIKLEKTWLANQLFEYLHSFYPDIERLTGSRFFHPKGIYRPFISVAEQNMWMGSSVDESIGPFIEQIQSTPRYPNEVNDPFGGIVLAKSGYVNTTEYVNAVREWVRNKGVIETVPFADDELICGDDSVTYKNYHAKAVIFCQGEGSLDSRFFKWLPINKLKGETLTIEASFIEDVIVNRGVYIVPCGKDMWRVGSTYKRGDITRDISSEGRQELKEKLEAIMKSPYRIENQNFGIRPSTHDRRPILGRHPKFKTIYIFNGLGTKGISLSPYFSEVLVNSIENGSIINQEVDISRYISLNWNSQE
jgi:glycine/D-amino acid oxidase-like deaminating enzyme